MDQAEGVLTRERDEARAEAKAEREGAMALRQRHGAQEDETFPSFVDRLASEHATALARLAAAEKAVAVLRRLNPCACSSETMGEPSCGPCRALATYDASKEG
jgi:hypothetical protein